MLKIFENKNKNKIKIKIIVRECNLRQSTLFSMVGEICRYVLADYKLLADTLYR